MPGTALRTDLPNRGNARDRSSVYTRWWQLVTTARRCSRRCGASPLSRPSLCCATCSCGCVAPSRLPPPPTQSASHRGKWLCRVAPPRVLRPHAVMKKRVADFQRSHCDPHIAKPTTLCDWQVRRHTSLVVGPRGLAVSGGRPKSAPADSAAAVQGSGAEAATTDSAAAAGEPAQAAADAEEAPAAGRRGRKRRAGAAVTPRPASAASATSGAPAATPDGASAEQGTAAAGPPGVEHAAHAASEAEAASPSGSAAQWPEHMASPGLPAVLLWASELLDAQLGAIIGRADAAQPLRELQVSFEPFQIAAIQGA